MNEPTAWVLCVLIFCLSSAAVCICRIHAEAEVELKKHMFPDGHGPRHEDV